MMAEGGQIFTPIKEGDLLHQAEIMTLRQISLNLQGITAELQASRADMTEMKVDVAIIKERQTQNQELKSTVAALEVKIEKLEARNLLQDGAYTFVGIMKDFGPWLISLIVLAWGLFERSPK